MMPISSICSNSWCAMRSRSGASRWARAVTGGPVVLMCDVWYCAEATVRVVKVV